MPEQKELKINSQPRIARELISEGMDFLDLADSSYSKTAKDNFKKQAVANLEAAAKLIREM